jgi:hypothetical protein
MSQIIGAWNLRNVSPEARAAAKQAAADAGLPLGTWLAQLIREIDAAELATSTPGVAASETLDKRPRLSSIERAMLQLAKPTGELAAA